MCVKQVCNNNNVCLLGQDIASTELEHDQAHVDIVINITNLTLVLT